MILSAIIWGFSGFILLTEDNSANMFIIVCIIGIATGGSVTLASDFNQIKIFLTIILFPYIIRFFLFNTQYYITVAILILVYYFLILGTGYKIHKNYL